LAYQSPHLHQENQRIKIISAPPAEQKGAHYTPANHPLEGWLYATVSTEKNNHWSDYFDFAGIFVEKSFFSVSICCLSCPDAIYITSAAFAFFRS
jgi:hypothetical protein